ncbi:MAG: hypothetical protein H7239_03980 [Flavobacterium sp.]|nr:hypothetical protein [Flavobacterium sp.]
MQTIKDNKTLAEAIAHLENVKKSELNLLKEHFHYTVHSLNPINIVKDKISDVFTSPTLKSDIATGIIAVGSTFIKGSGLNPIKNIVASLFKAQASKVVDNADEIKNNGLNFLQNSLQKLKIN